MKIVYVNDAVAIWGGLERLLVEKMNLMVKQFGHEIHLVTVNQGNHPFPYPLHPQIVHTDLGVGLHHKYRYHGLKRLVKTIQLEYNYITRMRRLMRKLRPDIVVLMRFEHWEVYFSVGWTPLVMECHSMCRCNLFGGTALQHSWVNLSKRLAKRAAVVVTLTEGDAKDWTHYTNRVCVIPNVVHLNMSGTYSNQKSKSVIFAGRISPQKDVFALLRIWRLVYDRHSDWVLDIYGEGENEEQVRQEIEAMNANVVLHAPTETIMEKFCESSIVVLTSEFEPFGLVMPEAMSCGLPVVAFDCPYGPSSIITEGVDGFLIADRNEKEFADKICLLIENPDIRRQMGLAAIQSAQRYRPDRIMPEWQKLFESILPQRDT